MKPNPVYIAARGAWNAGAELRKNRRRFKNYTYGRQWLDLVRSPDGSIVTEGEYARQSGKNPLTNNMIRQIVKSIVGRFRSNMEDGKLYARLDADAVARNMLSELDSRALEEFLISGCAIQRIVSERRLGGAGVWVDNVSPSRFFVNNFNDPRGSDIEIVGMLHDMSEREVLMRFAADDEVKRRRLAELFARENAFRGEASLLAAGEEKVPEFDRAEEGRCRLIEAWALESREMLKCHDRQKGTIFYLDPAETAGVAEMNRQREKAGEPAISTRLHHSARWHCYWFAPSGELVADYDSPYAHGSHPFAVKFYPLIDGEVHPFVEDIIDQQRYVNRLITLIDHVMSFSAKGVLLYPESQKPEGWTWSDVARLWCKPNGIIPYNDTGMHKPEQAYSNASQVGAFELLRTELSMFEQISGVSGAMQGRSTPGVTGAGLYNSQVENSTISLLDIFDTFGSFLEQRNRLLLST